MNYLTVGRNEILESSFHEVQDSNVYGSIKPHGGMWFTKFNQNFPNYNEWVDYLLGHPSILFYKNQWKNPFRQFCAMITLKENANIYYLRDREGYDYLVQNFYAREDQFSFQQLSHCYDGIYVDILSLASKLDSELVKLFASFGVNSLILFQKSAIQYYQSGVVLIDRFDYECGSVYRFIPYHIEIEEEKKLVGSCKNLRKV